jgi:hypothetical protein
VYVCRHSTASPVMIAAPQTMVGPGVVPHRSGFNNLDCQTAINAATGAKSYFVVCRTKRYSASAMSGDD